MFIYSVRANTIKFFGILGLATVIMLVLIFTLPTTATVSSDAVSEASFNYSKIRNEEERIEFLKQFGWEIEAPALEEIEIKIPTDFDKVMNSYNDIQKAQGLDLSKYKGKAVTRYTYKITNYPDYDGTVYANVIIHKNKVIGGDVCSSDVKGFIHGFEKVN